MLQRLFYLSAFATLTAFGCHADEILPEKTDEVPEQELVMNDEASDENSDEQTEETLLACSCKKKNRHFFQDEDQGDEDSDQLVLNDDEQNDEDSDEQLVFNDDEQNDEDSDEQLVFNDDESTEDEETSEELFV